MCDNIERFDELVARIFEKLYREFPRQVAIDPCELLDVTEQCEFNEIGEFISPLSDEQDEFFSYTLNWLYESGFLIGKFGGSWNSRLTLSLQGLQLLKSVPSSIDSNESIGEQLTHAIKSGSKESATALVRDALSTQNVMSLFSMFLNQS